MNLKKILKTLKLQENNISMVLGGLILLAIAVFVISYFRNLRNEQVENQAASTQQGQEYSVVKGDTLWSIAEKFYQSGNNWKNIADTNKISDPTKIEVGQKLTIPDVKTAEPVVPSPKPTEKPVVTQNQASPNVNQAITGANYTVVKGDSLWKIAVRAYGDGYQWIKVASANKLKHPNVIHPGNVFIIPR